MHLKPEGQFWAKRSQSDSGPRSGSSRNELLVDAAPPEESAAGPSSELAIVVPRVVVPSSLVAMARSDPQPRSRSADESSEDEIGVFMVIASVGHAGSAHAPTFS